MHDETFKGQVIYPVKTINTLEIYVRQGYRTLGCPKYVIFDKQGLAVAEPRTMREALRQTRTSN